MSNIAALHLRKFSAEAMRTAVSGVLALALMSPAGAASITVHDTDVQGRVFVDIVGPIADEDFITFRQKTDPIYPIEGGTSKKEVIVTLVSPGGNLRGGLRIGERIREKGMSTFVPNNRQCTSVCALIWLAGTPRTVGGNNARIGFHGAFRAGGEVTGPGNALVGAYLTKLGMGQAAIIGMTQALPQDMTWLELRQAREWDIVLEVMRPARTIAVPNLVATPAQDPSVSAQPKKDAASPAMVPVVPPVTTLPGWPAAAPRAILYEEDPADPNGKRFVGTAIWHTETVTSTPGQAPVLAVRADVEIPKRRLALTMLIRRNNDQALPASHTVEIKFHLTDDFPSGGISNVPGILMKRAEQTRGSPLTGLSVRARSGFFLLGLSAVENEQERNLQLVRERGWFDIPIVYNNGRRAIVAIEKGNPGERAFAEAFNAWKQ
jgi:hypothetical protein